MNSTRHVIIGSSAAGIGALSRLRKLDPHSSIMCITAQKQLPYNTCLLADYLGDAKELSQIIIKTQDFFDDNAIILKKNTCLVAIDTDTKIITVESEGVKEQVPYDTLFLGLGTQIVYPPISGIHDYAGVFSFHTLDDTTTILDYIKQRQVSKALIIGAGLSGVECADALSEHGIESDIVEMQQFLLPSLVDDEGAQFIERKMNAHGVTMHAQKKVVSVHGSDHGVEHAVLDTGDTISCQMIIVATGGQPCTTVARDAGIALENNRIVVDEYQQTSITDIYAAGDICMVRDVVTKQLVASTLWTDAMMQGMHAACAMAGQKRAYPGVCIITGSRFFDTMFISAGKIICPSNDYQEVIDESDEYYHKFMLDIDSRLCGFLMVGKAKALGKLRTMMISQKPVSAEDLFALE